MAKKVVVGIHGLANKPPQEILRQWWQDCLVEGLTKNSKIKEPNFNFEMVYWADLLYKQPKHTDPNFYFDSLYEANPYVPAKPGALKYYQESILDELKREALDAVGEKLDFLNVTLGLDNLTKFYLNQAGLWQDLQFYYDNQQKILNRQDELELVHSVLRQELKDVLVKFKGQEIMLIAHSMGSIIAYDALRDLGQEEPDLEVAYFVTIGSPLGIPFVKSQIIKERDYSPQVRTPSIVTKSWKNYADRKDKIAIDAHLADDYGVNHRGIQVQDDLVFNDYEQPGDSPVRKPHKSLGYLRTPELSQHLAEFLSLG